MKKIAAIECNGHFWSFIPQVSGGGLRSSRLSLQVDMDLDISLKEIGQCLINALNNYEFFISNLSPEFQKLINSEEDRSDWLKIIAQKYSLKSINAINKYMQLCSITVENDLITILPCKHYSTFGWKGTDNNFEVQISVNSSLEMIGAAVKYAIAHCEGKGADIVTEKLFPEGVPGTFEDYIASLDLSFSSN